MRPPIPSLWALLALTVVATADVDDDGGGPGNVTTLSDAIDSMNAFYNTTTAFWESGPWWHSGLALRALGEYMLVTNSRDYVSLADTVVQIQRAPLPWWPNGNGEFRADSTDDTGWWALALTTLYQVTGDVSYLSIARDDEAYMASYWDTSTCNGGLIWNIPTRRYHNAISNALYLELTATLHNLLPGDSYYLGQAQKEWSWFNASGMINPQGLVNDGLTEDAACVNNGQPVWTYNQGVVIAGLVQLAIATSDSQYIRAAQGIADAVVKDPLLSPGGILTEHACNTPADCEPNGTAFKGIFMRGLAKLNAILANHPYQSYIMQNAQSAYDTARNETDFYGFSWTAAFDQGTIGRQVAAVDLLLSTL